MNNELMIKAQTLLYNNQDRLEALVEALESVCGESNTKVAFKEKEPYKVTEKDLGSLCYFSDYEDEFDDGGIFLLQEFSCDVHEEFPFITNIGSEYRFTKPYTGKLKLHFTPFEAKEESRVPEEVMDHTGYVAILFNDGEVRATLYPEDFNWKYNANNVIVGYCLLDFVNFVLEE